MNKYILHSNIATFFCFCHPENRILVLTTFMSLKNVKAFPIILEKNNLFRGIDFFEGSVSQLNKKSSTYKHGECLNRSKTESASVLTS